MTAHRYRKPYLCKMCGEARPDEFYGARKTLCNACGRNYDHERYAKAKRVAKLNHWKPPTMATYATKWDRL